MPDGLLIDFLVLSQFFISTSLPLSVRGVQRRTYLLDSGQPNPPHMSTCNSWALGLIYGLKSAGVQFLTAEGDNGGD